MILWETGMGEIWGTYILTSFLSPLGSMGAENDFELRPPPLRLIILNHTFLKHFCTHRRKNCIVNGHQPL